MKKYKIGESVYHVFYGTGLVIGIDEDKYKVKFKYDKTKMLSGDTLMPASLIKY